MEYEVIGIRKFAYTPKNGGNSYEACNLYVKAPIEKRANDSFCEGDSCESIFCRSEMVSGIYVGDWIRVFYNKFGSVQEIQTA